MSSLNLTVGVCELSIFRFMVENSCEKFLNDSIGPPWFSFTLASFGKSAKSKMGLILTAYRGFGLCRITQSPN